MKSSRSSRSVVVACEITSLTSETAGSIEPAPNSGSDCDVSRLTTMAPGARRGIPSPFRLDCRPERRERDAELSGHMAPPNRPPPRLPRDRALRAGEHQPIFLRWTLLRRPLMADRSIVEHTGTHRENAASPKPSVEMAIRLFHGNNRCIVQQSLQPLAQERRQRDGPCLGLPPPPNLLTGPPSGSQALPEFTFAPCRQTLARRRSP